MAESTSNSELPERLPEALRPGTETSFPVAPVEVSVPMISFRHVSIWFDEHKILNDVSFTVDRGQTLCILGRSGVGKSVALRILMGFLKPQVGSICLDG